MDLRAGQNHDQGGRLNHRYQYPDHDLRSEGMDWRFMQKYKPEQTDLQSRIVKITEERDELQTKFEHVYAQHIQIVKKIRYENEKLEQDLLHRIAELEKKYRQLLDERSDFDCAVQDRDNLKYKLNELQRENQRFKEKLQSITPNYDASRRECEHLSEQRDQLKSTVTELKRENQQLKDQLKSLSGQVSVVSDSHQEIAKLKEDTTNLTQQLKQAEEKLIELEYENSSLKDLRDSSPVKNDSEESLGRQSSSEESIGGGNRGRRGRGRSQEDLYGRRHSTSIPELERMNGTNGQERFSFAAKKKFSASTSNLWEIGEERRGQKDSVVAQLQSQLNRIFKEKEKLSQKYSGLRDSSTEMETRIRSLEEERDGLKEELGKSRAATGTAQKQLKMIKGVAVQQSTETYEKSMQLETQLLELQTEKTLVEKQRDIALKERDRVVTDAISLKKKLETIKAQRQKDAKELASMRKHKDKAVHENQELTKQLKFSNETLKKVQAHNTKLVDILKPLAISHQDRLTDDKELERLVERIKQERSDLVAIMKSVYNRECVDGINSSDVVSKIDSVIREKSDLVLEIEDLQRSASKLNEDHIFELKQKIESLHMELDAQIGKNKTHLAQHVKLESERDKLRQECDRLDSQCQDMNATLSSPARISGLLRNSMQQHLEEMWELKHLQVPLGNEGLAGFSVVGGKDQPQLPNPGAFIVTIVNKGGPADGILRVGDVLEKINGVDLLNADHSKAVHAVKESKGLLDIVLRRRKRAHAIQVGVAGAILTLGESEKRKKPHEFSFLLQKEGIGFTWDWEAHYTVTGITEGGVADKILCKNDKILQINGTSVTKEKPSVVKKLLKPNKGVLRLVVEREEEPIHTCYLTSDVPPPSVSEILTPSKSTSGGSDQGSGHSSSKNRGGSSWGSEDYSQNSQDHTALHKLRPDSYSQDSTTSQEPVKIVGASARIRSSGRGYVGDSLRPTSDGVMYNGFQEKRVEFEEYSSEIGSTGYSESVGESFLSEPSSYPDDCLPIDSSQTSIELTFHSISQVSHNRLTVQSTISTQNDKRTNSDEDETYFARDDGTRTTFRTRSGSDGAVGNSQYPEIDSTKSSYMSSKSSKQNHKSHNSRKGWRSSASLSQLSEPEYEQYSSKKKSRSKSMLAIRGKSRSNLSLTPARSMTSVREEPVRSASVNSVTSEHDPLADATYIRANFSYVPRYLQELSIKCGDVFHIIDEAPSARHRRSFWVSRLNDDGTDSGVGAIPNTSRAQQWLDEQGEALDCSIYEEVEAFNGTRPVIICGVLAEQITTILAESYPKMFYHCRTEFIEGTARITEARLNREQSEGRIIYYNRVGDSGFRVVPKGAFTSWEHKGKHVLMAGSLIAVQSLKSFAPPISILIKAGAEDSITTFGYDSLSLSEIKQMYADARMMNEQHGHEFTACLMLVFEETLLKQITDIVQHEKHNQTWVPINRLQMS